MQIQFTLDVFGQRIAVVDGAPLTHEQTKQALRDGRLCKCGVCLCCALRKALDGGDDSAQSRGNG
jgi:hypothetical protein